MLSAEMQCFTVPIDKKPEVGDDLSVLDLFSRTNLIRIKNSMQGLFLVINFIAST
jgi:hypothetical protein